MSLQQNIIEYLDRPGKNIVIVNIQDVLFEYGSIFEFVDEIKHWSNENWDTELLRRESDDGEESRIVLAAYPSKIQEERVTGKRIYIVENSDEVHPRLTPHKV